MPRPDAENDYDPETGREVLGPQHSRGAAGRHYTSRSKLMTPTIGRRSTRVSEANGHARLARTNIHSARRNVSRSA